MDGLDGNTVYEFLACLWHGCYPHRRNMTHAIMPDRSPNEAYRATLEKLGWMKQ